MDTNQSSAPAHPSTDDTVETHYAGLERLGCFACYDGVVYLTYEEDGHEWTEPVPCRRCNAQRS